MIKSEYKGYKILKIEKKYLELACALIDNDYEVIKEFKNTKRNYVVLIKHNNFCYVLKSPRNEFRIPQRKFFTLFKEGEALTTFRNINSIEGEFKESFALPLLAISKKKGGMIADSHIIYEVVGGMDASEDKELAVKYTKEMHKIGRYHGDCNPSNFIITKDGVKIIDTQAKKMIFGNYRAHYDMITMKIDSYPEMNYPYKKNLFYYLALAVKLSKRMTLVEKVKGYKKILRDKGWKI